MFRCLQPRCGETEATEVVSLHRCELYLHDGTGTARPAAPLGDGGAGPAQAGELRAQD